jgi:hypothetical protein
MSFNQIETIKGKDLRGDSYDVHSIFRHLLGRTEEVYKERSSMLVTSSRCCNWYLQNAILGF